MMKRTLWAWVLLIVLPLIPVILLYAFFSRQNYFELKDAAKGIVAIGPIAAYVVIVGLGLEAMLRIEREGRNSNHLLENVTGEWTIESKSLHGTPGRGRCYMENDRGRLVVNGELSENGMNLGTWQSEITMLKEHNLYIFYTLTQVKDTGSDKFDGICTLSFGSPPTNEMRGTWIVVGEKDRAGEITFKRKNP
jgi:hypothetical protein